MQINHIQAMHSTDSTQYCLASLMCSLLTFTKGKYNPPRTLTSPHSRTFTPVPEQPSSKAFHKHYLACVTRRYLGKQTKSR